MAHTHRSTISWPIPLWCGIRAEAHKHGMTPQLFIVTTMDAIIRKSQEDYID
ncbi:MAG: hypothetical protein ABWY12_11180 [Burkholderiales bacterium]